MKERESIKHPSLENWKQFLEEERFYKETSEEIRHLEGCRRCKEKVIGLLKTEQSLFSLLKGEMTVETGPHQEYPPCVQKEALWNYADFLLENEKKQELVKDPATRERGLLLTHELKSVESHIETCDHCLTVLIGMQKFLARVDRA